ncbi:lipid A biosynthesis lauroyl acyltransferase [Roseomonas populi]|uniref:Lipid A biosynthesis lauroyl acyltransferase n=1 Tax=Roseomonas populi TaxID=3121582 RepID=A0ABT1X0E4_9PROT|nr:lipid A biosynthesis lauroyl acyltransferase [Roseomonas pecuniae]MCR0981566.1 lipid A biosynthesis lauroyl acyltransferase [Roseomonas pecuniae]
MAKKGGGAADAALSALTGLGFAVPRALGPDLGPRVGSALARRLGPLTKAHRIAMENIAAAFPEKDTAWHRRIADEAWDNLGRTAAEYVHINTIWDLTEARDPKARIQIDDATFARFAEIREQGGPCLVFAAHLANWELPAVAAAKHGLDAAVLYRTPNSKPVADAILKLRKGMMGELIPAGLTAPTKLAKALQRGAVVGMVVDQRFGRGPVVDFLGRPAHANPLLANLARRFDCPVRGARAIRLEGGRFRLELTDPIPMPRDAEGLIDVNAATQAVNDVIAGWVREHPGQWLWMHRRWR